jgi:hypothetical protein
VRIIAEELNMNRETVPQINTEGNEESSYKGGARNLDRWPETKLALHFI